MANAATSPAKKVENRGGKRVGAGRKSRALEDGAADAHIVKARAVAHKETYQAKLAELDYNIKAGKYVLRADVVQSNSTAYQMVAQAMRSIPDNLERRLGIAPETAEEISAMIEEAMDALYEQMGQFDS